MFRRIAAVITATALAGSAAAEEPLQSLARHVPLDAEGNIYLIDLTAAARQVGKFAVGDPAIDRLMPFSTVLVPPGFDRSIFQFIPDGLAKELGFAVWEIDQIAGWGPLPEAPVVMRTDRFDRAKIEAALLARGFARSDRTGKIVWHRQNDFEIVDDRRFEDPFTGTLGISERFSLTGDMLRFTRAWPAMDKLLSGGASILEDPDAAAILSAAYALKKHGDVLDVVLLGRQLRRLDMPKEMLGQAATPELLAALRRKLRSYGPGLPPFRRHAVALWQQGTRMIGALLIPYPDGAAAEAARERFSQLLGKVRSEHEQRLLGDLLPKTRLFEVVAAGERAVLVLAFEQEVEVSDGVDQRTFMNNPRSRIWRMIQFGDMDVLIGAAD